MLHVQLNLDCVDSLFLQRINHFLRLVRADAHVVFDFLNRLMPAHSVRDQYSAVGRVFARALTTSNVPRIADDELEVVIVIDPVRDGGVIALKLLQGDSAVVVSDVKAVQKILEDLNFGLVACEDIGLFAKCIR